MTIERDRPRYLAVLGSASAVGAWSGIPHHFHTAGEEVGLFQGALDLRTGPLRWRRRAWNLTQVLRGDRWGGFQYSRACLQRLFRTVAPILRGAEVISHFQLFPPSDLARDEDVRAAYYIDMPLTRLFEEYGVARRIGRAIAREALVRERDGYTQARYVVCMSSWAARAVRDEYGIPPERVRWVLPGANISEPVAQAVTAGLDREPIPSAFGPRRPFRLGFTGGYARRDYERKGLPRLVAAADILRARGYAVEVVVIGHAPQYARHPAVRYLGFIDKGREARRFAEAVKRYDLGCLLSHAEGLGIALLECLRLGVPVMGTLVGGIQDSVPAGAGLRLPADVTPLGIAEAIRDLLEDPDRYVSLRAHARTIRERYRWQRTAVEFLDLLEGRPR